MKNILFAGIALFGFCGAAHAASDDRSRMTDLMKINPSFKACSTKFVKQWNLWDHNSPQKFLMPIDPCITRGIANSIHVCDEKDCYSADEWIEVHINNVPSDFNKDTAQPKMSEDEAKIRLGCVDDNKAEFHDGKISQKELQRRVMNCMTAPNQE